MEQLEKLDISDAMLITDESLEEPIIKLEALDCIYMDDDTYLRCYINKNSDTRGTRKYK